SAKNGIGALSVAAIELHSSGETFGQQILINAAALLQNFNDGQRHLGVVSIGPRRIGKLTSCDSLHGFMMWRKESFSKCIANGQAVEREPCSVECIHRSPL